MSLCSTLSEEEKDKELAHRISGETNTQITLIKNYQEREKIIDYPFVRYFLDFYHVSYVSLFCSELFLERQVLIDGRAFIIEKWAELEPSR